VHCLITAGPTYEPLDHVRRLTNFSTGQLGSELARLLSSCGHSVTLLLGEHSTYRGELVAQKIERFTTTTDLEQRLHSLSTGRVDALFHAAAVSDFKFGKVWLRNDQNQLIETKAGKISTRQGTLLAELIPTPKMILQLRNWFPNAILVGWKFEVDGDQAHLINLARQQLIECRTNACVANGPAYGPGFGLVTPGRDPLHARDKSLLFSILQALLENRAGS
jgi:phosphopantothenoylcysteine decarboxylase/phosphopantothenate--cysteine ligase